MKIPVVRPSLNHKEQNFLGPPKFIAQLRLWDQDRFFMLYQVSQKKCSLVSFAPFLLMNIFFWTPCIQSAKSIWIGVSFSKVLLTRIDESDQSEQKSWNRASGELEETVEEKEPLVSKNLQVPGLLKIKHLIQQH